MELVLGIVVPLLFALGGSQAFLYYKMGRVEQKIIDAVNGSHCKEEDNTAEEFLGGG